MILVSTVTFYCVLSLWGQHLLITWLADKNVVNDDSRALMCLCCIHRVLDVLSNLPAAYHSLPHAFILATYLTLALTIGFTPPFKNETLWLLVYNSGYKNTEDTPEKPSLAGQDDSRLIFLNQQQYTKFCSNRVR